MEGQRKKDDSEDCMFLSFTYAFQRESTIHSCLNVKELFAESKCKIWILSDCNWTWTQNHLVRKWTLNHLAKLAKWLSVCLWTKWFWVRVQLQLWFRRTFQNIEKDIECKDNDTGCNEKEKKQLLSSSIPSNLGSNL